MKSIALISCYMGKLPWYFAYFTYTCKYNPTVNFIIITDNRGYRDLLPDNVLMLHKSLEEVNAIATAKLGFETNILSPYKLCDFKPAYGLIFSDLVEQYDFWGHCDIDIILGDIRSFITEHLLNSYELIAVRHDFLTGYFLLFKNTQKLRMLFTNSKDYKKVLSSERHFCFDETNFTFNHFEVDTHYSKINSEVESMTHVVRRLSEANTLKAYFDFHVIEGVPGKLSWNRGKLMYRNKYFVILYHLISFKTVCKPRKRVGRIKDSFGISRTRIYNKA